MRHLVIDPGLDGDVYADEPYLYGPAASSINTIHIGPKQEGNEERDEETSDAGLVWAVALAPAARRAARTVESISHEHKNGLVLFMFSLMRRSIASTGTTAVTEAAQAANCSRGFPLW